MTDLLPARYLELCRRLRGNIREDDYVLMIQAYNALLGHRNKLAMFEDEDGFLYSRVRANRDMKATTFVARATAGAEGTIVGWKRDHNKKYTFLVKFDTDPHPYFVKRTDFEVIE